MKEFDEESYRIWREKYVAAVEQFKELRDRLKKEGRRLTQEEELRLFELLRDIEDGALMLKNLKPRIGEGVHQ